jgi:CheY-like chemotaxis protein
LSKNVLLVEDDRDISECLTEFLQSEGYQVQNASNGKVALELLRTRGPLPDIILLDLMMPIMDGFAFREEQLKNSELALIPVVLMTADSQIEVAQQKLRVGFFVRKPVDIEALSVLLGEI